MEKGRWSLTLKGVIFHFGVVDSLYWGNGNCHFITNCLEIWTGRVHSSTPPSFCSAGQSLHPRTGNFGVTNPPIVYVADIQRMSTQFNTWDSWEVVYYNNWQRSQYLNHLFPILAPQLGFACNTLWFAWNRHNALILCPIECQMVKMNWSRGNYSHLPSLCSSHAPESMSSRLTTAVYGFSSRPFLVPNSKATILPHSLKILQPCVDTIVGTQQWKFKGTGKFEKGTA